MSTAIPTASVATSTDVLQDVQKENRELRLLLAIARAIVSSSSFSGRLHQWVDVLRRLDDALAMHFALEEALGYFDEPVEIAPHLVQQAEQFLSEHQILYLNLCDIIDAAERALYQEPGAPDVDQLAGYFREFDAEFLDHESREKELLLQAFDEDIGVGD